jgi:hypothetical protein
MKIVGQNFATAGIALVSVAAIAGASAVQPPPQPAPVPVVQLAAASPAVAQPPPEPRSGVFQSLVELDLNRFVIPPSVSQPAPVAPQVPGPSPTPGAYEFEDAIIDTYHAIEPWVRYGFELVTWGVGWVPWVGWLAPQIMIFYDFGEHIVESLVVNSANWLWGPLPFGEGLGNVAQDSWDALVQLGIDQWNFWLWPLPPLPFAAAQTNSEPAETSTPAVDQAASTSRPHPRRDDVGRPVRKDDRGNLASREDPDAQEGEEPASDADEPASEDSEPATPKEREQPASRTSLRKKPGAQASSSESSRSEKKAGQASTSHAESRDKNGGETAKRDSDRSPRHTAAAAE